MGCAKKFGLTLLLFTVLHCRRVECQSCPSMSSALLDSSTSCTLNNCTSLTCVFPVASQLSGSVTFNVENCSNPVRTHVAVAITGAPLAYKVFVEPGGMLYLALGRSVKVVQSRNTSHVFLEVEYKPVTVNATFSYPVVPPVQVPLWPTECMCQSLTDMSEEVQTNSLVHSCETSAGCRGVRCQIGAVGQTGYVESIVLPCMKALDVIVEDENFVPVSRQVFNQTESRNIRIGTYTIRSDVTIVPRSYSMDVALSVYQLFIGHVQILPPHTIILDKTNCSTPNLTTSAPPIVPTPLPPPGPDPSSLCSSLYNEVVSKNYTEPLICTYLSGSCDVGVSCILLLFGYSYHIEIMANASVDAYFSFRVVNNSGGDLPVTTQDQLSSVSMLSGPRGAELLFAQASIHRYLKRFQINLHLTFENEEFLDTVLPVVTVNLRYEPCQSIVAALADVSTDCVIVGECLGISCSLGVPGTVAVANDVTVEVYKCIDPIVAEVSVLGAISSKNNITHDDSIFFGGGESLAVKMSRNATVLNFTASFVSGNSSSVVVPPVLFPLNVSTCMCQSVQHLAQVSSHSFIETNCIALDCSSIRCELNILGSIYYLETAILPCEDVIDFFVEDSSLNILSEQQFDKTEVRDIVVANLPLTLSVVLVKQTYSMDIQATLTDDFFGANEIVPMTTIILDRTSCNHQNFTTVAPPPPVTPPAPPTSGQSETCLGFYNAIKSTTKEPFTCQYYGSCDTGVKCSLKILNTSYIIIIGVSENRTSLTLSVSDPVGHIFPGEMSTNAITVRLSYPNGTNLTLSQTYDSDSNTVRMQLELDVYVLSGQVRRDVLIPSTEIVIKRQSTATKPSAVVVAVPVVVVVLVVAVSAVVVVVVLFLVFRSRRRVKQFEFQRMSPTRLGGNGEPSLIFSEEEKKDHHGEEDDGEDDDGFRKVDLGDRNGVHYK